MAGLIKRIKVNFNRFFFRPHYQVLLKLPIGLVSIITDQATPSAALAKEKGVVFVVPRFRLGPMGFLPRLLLNDTSSVIKDSTSFQVRLMYFFFLLELPEVMK